MQGMIEAMQTTLGQLQAANRVTAGGQIHQILSGIVTPEIVNDFEALLCELHAGDSDIRLSDIIKFIDKLSLIGPPAYLIKLNLWIMGGSIEEYRPQKPK